MVKKIVYLSCALLFVAAQSCRGQSRGERIIGDLTLQDIRQSAIAFVTTSSSPGLDGADMHISDERRESQMWRSSLGYAADITLREKTWDLYWGAAITGGAVDEQFSIFEDNGNVLAADIQRKVVALRGSLGVSVPVSADLSMRSYFSAYWSDMHSESFVYNQRDDDSPIGSLEGAYFNTNVYSLTSTGVLEMDWRRWFGSKELKLLGQYNISYTDTYSINNPHLDAWGWSEMAIAKAQLNAPTGLLFLNREWRWFTFLHYTDFIDQPKIAIGFTHFYELGAGVEWQFHIKPLDWFGFRAAGLKAGYIFGDDITGFNLGLVIR